jgi:hypothetical protein
MSYSTSTALIPYVPPQTPMEFIHFQVKKTKKPLIDILEKLVPAFRNHWMHDDEFDTLNGDEIAEALQSEVSFTTACDKKPIVATYGCGPCIAVGGYEPTNKIAFVAHFSHAREVIECGGTIFYTISKLAKQKIEKPIQIHLRGGWKGEETSEKTVNIIKKWMACRKDIPMELASEDLFDETSLCPRKSLSIDSRTGIASTYNPTSNPNRRTVDSLSVLANGITHTIQIAYSPKS